MLLSSTGTGNPTPSVEKIQRSTRGSFRGCPATPGAAICGGPLFAGNGWLFVDALSAYHAAVLALVFGASSLYAWGYFGAEIAADKLAESYHCSYNLPIAIARPFNVFGPREYYKGHASSMIYQLALKMMEGHRPRIFKWGEQKRDHIYVKDVVTATLMAHKSKESTLMNLGTGQATSFNEIVDALNEALGTNYKPDYFDNPYSFYQNFTQADMSHHEKMTGFRCSYTTREGILDYVRNHLLKTSHEH